MRDKVTRIGDTVIAAGYRTSPTKENPQGVPLINSGPVASIDLSVTGTITHTFAAGFDYWAIIDQLVPTNDAVIVFLRFNGDSTGTAYAWGGTTRGASDGDASDGAIDLTLGVSVGSAANEQFGPFTINFSNPSSATLYKQISGRGGYIDSGGAARDITVFGFWKNAAAVTSVEIGDSASAGFDSGTFTLYRSSRT